MTIRELVEVAPFCDSLEIVIRENGCGQWIQGYRIGKEVEQFPYEKRAEVQEAILPSGKKVTYMRTLSDDKASRRLTDGEIREIVTGSKLPMKIIKKDVSKLPDEVANLNVCHFQPRHIPSFHRELLTHNDFMLEINAYPEGWTKPKEETKKDQKEEQLEGQTDIFDFI